MKKVLVLFFKGRATACHNHRRQSCFVTGLLLLLYLGIGNSAFAQTGTVSGTVKDDSGSPLEGVSVVLKGSKAGTSTSSDGKFSLPVSTATARLVISYTGFGQQETVASPGSPVIIVLRKDSTTLSDVVVVGYGTQKRRDVTGAISTVNISDVKDVPASNVGRLLVGQVPGVTARQNTGQPGKSFEITIRGTGSLGAGSAPLYVVDGLPVGNDLGQNFNGNDIESLTILKDAVSSAIYGARGSNGVALITTKMAKVDQSFTSVSANFGISNVPDNRRTKMMNGPEFGQFLKERFQDAYYAANGVDPADSLIPANFRNPESITTSTDWYQTILHNNAPFQNYNVTTGGGTRKMRNLLSVDYNRQEGALRYTSFDRFSLRDNMEAKVSDFFTVGTKLTGSYVRNNLARSTEGRDQVVGSSLLVDPRDPVYNPDGSLNLYIGNQDGVFGYPNPLLLLRDVKTLSETAQIMANTYAEINFLGHFKFRTAFNTFLAYNQYKQFTPSDIGGQLGGGAPPQIARESDASSATVNYSADQLLTYSNEIGRHRFDVLAGYTSQQEVGKNLSASGSDYPNDLVPYLIAAARKDASSGEYTWTTEALFGRVNYVFDEKYLLTATFRREASSRFGIDTKWGNFPAVSAGWRIFNENFFPKTGFINDLKLRGSYGVTGNNNIGNYISLAVLNKNDYDLNGALVRGVSGAAPGNPTLRWEKSTMANLGMDISAFNDKLTFSMEYYNKITTDMLLPVEVPAISGTTTFFTNIGKIRNRGLEFQAGYHTRFNKVGFRVDGNIFFNRSKVLAISDQQDQLLGGNFYGAENISKVGQPIGLLYGFRVLGIFQNQDEVDKAPAQDGAIPGVFRMYDADGNGEISYDNKDMVVIGNPDPKGRYGASVNVDYAGFDLTVGINGAFGFQIYRSIEESTLNMDGVFNVLEMAKNRWRRPEIPNTGKRTIPTTNTWKWERESNSSYIYQGDHIWIKNITLGYTFHNSKVLKNPRVFVGADNFLLFSKYPGSNPDVNLNGGIRPGEDDESYPLPRIFNLGVNFNL